MEAERKVHPAAIVVLAAGALMVLGSTLPWIQMSVDLGALQELTGSSAGMGGFNFDVATAGLQTDGGLTALLGAAALAVGVLWLTGMAARRAGLLAIVAGAVGGFVVIAAITFMKDDGLGSAMSALSFLPSELENVLKVTPQVGAWLALGGAVLALTGGAWAVLPARPAATAPATAAPAAEDVPPTPEGAAS